MPASKNTYHQRYQFQLAFLAPRYWGTWLGLLLFFLVTLLPLSVVDALGGRIGSFAAKKNRKRFNIASKNLSLCFPDKSQAEIEAMVMAHFQAQFRSVLHYFLIWWRPEAMLRKRILTRGFEQISEYRQQGKNIIVLLTHNVGLDIAGAAVSMDHEANSVFKAMRNPVVNWLIARGRLRFGEKIGGRLFMREDGLRPLIRETRAGKVLIYLADEDLGGENPLFAPFFGVPKATVPLLGRLAKSCDAVVLPCVSCYREDRRQYEVTMLSKIEGLPSGDDAQDSRLMNRAIEQAIALCPVQYMWTLRYFQTRPQGEASVYE